MDALVRPCALDGRGRPSYVGCSLPRYKIIATLDGLGNGVAGWLHHRPPIADMERLAYSISAHRQHSKLKVIAPTDAGSAGSESSFGIEVASSHVPTDAGSVVNFCRAYSNG